MDFTLVRIVELTVATTGALTLNVYSDQPGNTMTLRETRTVDTSATSGRRVARFRLAGTTRGRLFRWELSGFAACRFYDGRVYAKVGAADWAWYALPIAPTPEAWAEVNLPIEPTPEGWAEVQLPIAPTSESWIEARLAIPETADLRQWREIPASM